MENRFIHFTHRRVGRIARDEAKGWGVEDIWIVEGGNNISQLRLERYDMVSGHHVLYRSLVKCFISLIES